MDNNFTVSVIIPVFNAERYVERAVLSALNECEVGEVLLIEDCSPDNALAVCEKIAELYPKVKLLQHPDKSNHGAAASRNLGIVNSKFKYIAFLDADDYYLPNRFKEDKKILDNDSSVDGVYNAIAPVPLNETGQDKIKLRKTGIMTMANYYDPEALFENLAPVGDGGFFSLNGLTVRRSIFTKTGLFDHKLRLSQDTDICIKMAAIGKLMSGNLRQPVAMFGVHDLNRSHNTDNLTLNRPYLFYQLYKWALTRNISKKRVHLLWQRFYEYNNVVNKINRKQQIHLLLLELLKNPSLISSYFFRKQLPFIHRFI